MSLADLIPGARGVEAIVFTVLVTAVAGTLYAQHVSNVSLRAQLQAEKEGRAADRQSEQAAASGAQATNKAKAAEWVVATKETADETSRLESRALAAVVAGASVDRGLRDDFRASIAAGRGGAASAPAAAAGSASGPAAGVVQADVFGRLDDATGELALAADRAYTRGLGCERADAVTR